MATRLEAALEQLAKALRGRPYVLVFQQNHEDAQVQNIGTVRPSAQPLYVSRGLIMEAHDFLVAEAGDRSEVSSKEHRPEPAPALADMGHGPQAWERDDARIADTVAVICTRIRTEMVNVRAFIMGLSDEEARYAEEWAAREIAYRQGDGAVQRWNRPKFFPERWYA